ncbi:MAG: 3-deoxy-manno-octulosonate cytidylyltransferase [Pseudomonadota bacterium]
MLGKSPKFFVVIPARYASTRLPGKPLVDICGKPMIQHVYEQAKRSGATDVVIATDDTRIQDAAEGFGATVCMTRADHQSGTDRVAEVAQIFGWSLQDIVVNVQGDEPMLPPQLILQVADLLENNQEAGLATLSTPVTSVEEFLNTDVVKVVSDQRQQAICFSRCPIPWNRDSAPEGLLSQTNHQSAQRHIGLYAYRVASLIQLSRTPPCAWETLERLEQLRALWLGIEISVAESVEIPMPGVDNKEDLEQVRQVLHSQNQ